MKTLLFTIAHRVKSSFATFSEALKYAWKIIKLKSKLSKEIVSFKYKKVDGTVRSAVGTLKGDMLPTGKGKSSSPSVMTYFDVEVNGYRCCKIENLIF